MCCVFHWKAWLFFVFDQATQVTILDEIERQLDSLGLLIGYCFGID